MAVSANRLELLQIADAVAREKLIDRQIVISAMEESIAKAARSRYGLETDIHAEINPKTGELRIARHLLVADAIDNPATQISIEDARKRNPAAQSRRLHLRAAAALRVRPGRGAIGKAGDRAEGARGGARPAI